MKRLILLLAVTVMLFSLSGTVFAAPANCGTGIARSHILEHEAAQVALDHIGIGSLCERPI